MMQALWNRLRTKLFINREEIVIEDPEEPQKEETTQSIESLTLQEQLQIFQQVDEYMKEYTPKYALNDEQYEKGFSMKPKIFKTDKEGSIARCNLEVFYRKKGMSEKIESYLVSLIKFEEEKWQVFQVK